MLPALFLLAVAALSAAPLAAADDNQFNQLIDEVIYENVKFLVDKGLDRIVVPDIHKEFKVPVFGGLKAEVNLTNGLFWNTTSLQRIGDALEVDGPDGAMVISLALGMKEAKAQFQLGYSLGFIKADKNVYVECSDNSVYVKATVRYDESHNCSVSLDVAEIQSLAGFKVVINPPTMFDKLESHLFGFTLNHVAAVIKNTVNKSLAPVLRQYLTKVNICGALPF